MADGRLEGWYKQGTVVWGHIFDDKKGRFPDGLKIHTSRIAGTTKVLEEGDVIKTLNSTYLLGKPYFNPEGLS